MDLFIYIQIQINEIDGNYLYGWTSQLFGIDVDWHLFIKLTFKFLLISNIPLSALSSVLQLHLD